MPSIRRPLGALALVAVLAGYIHAHAATGAAPIALSPAPAVVSTAAGLAAAQKAAPAGGVILLAPGTYPNVVIANWAAPGVTIASADPAHRAVLPAAVIRQSSGITLRDLDFPSLTDYGLNLVGDSDVTVVRPHVFSAVVAAASPAANTLSGVGVWGGRNITVTGGDIHDVKMGLIGNTSDHVTISNNALHDIREHGVHFAQVTNLAVTGNSFSAFYPLNGPAPIGDHPDAIFLTTAGTKVASAGITIADNAVIKGAGAVIQGIFIKDDAGGLPYAGLIVRNNLVIGDGYNALAVNGATAPVLTLNRVYPYVANSSWERLQNTTAASVTHEAAGQLIIDATNARPVQSANSALPVITPAQGADLFAAWLATHLLTPR